MGQQQEAAGAASIADAAASSRSNVVSTRTFGARSAYRSTSARVASTPPVPGVYEIHQDDIRGGRRHLLQRLGAVARLADDGPVSWEPSTIAIPARNIAWSSTRSTEMLTTAARDRDLGDPPPLSPAVTRPNGRALGHPEETVALDVTARRPLVGRPLSG